jgi:hypothetical protein
MQEVKRDKRIHRCRFPIVTKVKLMSQNLIQPAIAGITRLNQLKQLKRGYGNDSGQKGPFELNPLLRKDLNMRFA